ncbi:MAG: isopenicillin N synthase family oxygenase [Flavobacteriales bacterium]|nr:isopenicillin N synthase family oxygenase [Flavobacteriales bacterium]
MKELPIIDLCLSEQINAERVHSALKDVGFLYIKNHGVPAELQTGLTDLAKRFFQLEQSQKRAIAMEKGGKAWRGYFPFKGELTSGIPDLKEGLYFGVEHGPNHPEVVEGTPLHGCNQWPGEEELSEMKLIVSAYMDHMEKLGHHLMELTAMGLGLEKAYFSVRYGKEPTMLFRIFNYPFQKELDPSSSWGVQEHSDMGFLTMLLQDENEGLEVKSRGSDEWIAAPPIPGTFVVNIGDMLELWTHGIYQATLHRVKNTSGNDRMSFPFFFDPSWHSKLKPIDAALLRTEELANVPPSTTRKWDGADIRSLSHDATYGRFVWEKVRTVFPNL